MKPNPGHVHRRAATAGHRPAGATTESQRGETILCKRMRLSSHEDAFLFTLSFFVFQESITTFLPRELFFY